MTEGCDCRKEINSWRRNFLEEAFSGAFKYIPDNHKGYIKAYFLSIPSESFTTPWHEWNKCIGVLLQQLGDIKK